MSKKREIPQRAWDMLNRGATSSDLVRERIIDKNGNPVSPRSATRWVSAFLHGRAVAVDNFVESVAGGEDAKLVAQLLKDHPMSLHDLSEMLDRSESSVRAIVAGMREGGFNIEEDRQKFVVPSSRAVLPIQPIEDPITREHTFTAAFPSDNHAGSKEEQITALLSFRRTAREMGARHFFHAGDICTGYHMYKGHNLDVYAPTMEGQLACAERTLAPEEDEEWYVLGGNHCFSWLKSGGADIVYQHCAKWENAHYLGFDEATVPLTDKVSIRLWHPTGGMPYASSYRLQKGMETLAFEELLKTVDDSRVKILVAGHLHIALEFPQGGVYGIHAGCFEGRTSLLKRLGKYPRVGGYIKTFYWNDSGNLTRVDSTWLPYEPIKDDYRRYPEIESIKEPERIETIYHLDEDGGASDA